MAKEMISQWSFYGGSDLEILQVKEGTKMEARTRRNVDVKGRAKSSLLSQTSREARIRRDSSTARVFRQLNKLQMKASQGLLSREYNSSGSRTLSRLTEPSIWTMRR
jgi:hypothetical protein